MLWLNVCNWLWEHMSVRALALASMHVGISFWDQVFASRTAACSQEKIHPVMYEERKRRALEQTWKPATQDLDWKAGRSCPLFCTRHRYWHQHALAGRLLDRSTGGWQCMSARNGYIASAWSSARVTHGRFLWFSTRLAASCHICIYFSFWVSAGQRFLEVERAGKPFWPKYLGDVH